jgi:hypothetical protein
LYRSETWFPLLREQTAKEDIWARGGKVMGVWRRWQNVELQDLSSSSNISWVIKKIRWVRHVAGMRQKRNVCRVLVGTPEGSDRGVEV